MSVEQMQPSRVRANLPDIVLRYVERNVSLDAWDGKRVRFTQVGEMQLRPGQWLPFRAKQEIAVDRVEFAC